MTTAKKRTTLFTEEVRAEIEQKLITLSEDVAYNTVASYSANEMDYPDHIIPFVNKHMKYLKDHPSTDPFHYVANLRIMTRIR